MYVDSSTLVKELKAKGFKDLGWANGWGETKPEIKACQDAKHQIRNEQHNQRGSDNTVYCETCKHFYKYDCSD